MTKKTIILGLTILISLNTAFPALAEWQQQESVWKYQEGNSGYAANKWLKINNLWYYFSQSAEMQTGWIKLNEEWYYLDKPDGYMKTGWFLDEDGSWYYLDATNGNMWKNKRTPDGYYVNQSGVYDASKGKINDNNKSGPGSKISQEKTATLLKGIEFPELQTFALGNLTSDKWGTDGSLEALTVLNATMQSSFQIDGNTITYAPGGTVKLKLAKAGDHYEINDYGSIDTDMETALLAMCYLISSTPQQIYNSIYTASEYDQTIMRSEYYTSFGDGKILYTVHDDYICFSITKK